MWRPTATLDKTALGSSAAQIWSPRRCQVGNAVASGGLKWQYIAIIARFSSLSPFHHLPSVLTERNSTKTCHMFGSSAIWKCISYLGIYLRGQKTTYFRRLSTTSQLNCKFNGLSLYLRSEIRYKQSGNGLETAKNLLQCPKLSWNLIH